MMNEEKFAKRLSLITRLIKDHAITREESELLLEYERVEEKTNITDTSDFILKYKDLINQTTKLQQSQQLQKAMPYNGTPFTSDLASYVGITPLSSDGLSGTVTSSNNLSNLYTKMTNGLGVTIHSPNMVINTTSDV